MIKRNNKTVALVSVLLAGAVFMSACSVDMNGVGDAFRNLGNNLNDVVNETSEETEMTVSVEPTDEIVIETSIVEETEVTEVADVEVEATATPTPTATSTPTPTPTPVPQRVDFSELTEDSLFGTITVETEEFMESSYATDDDDLVLATFSGDRVLLSSEDDIAVVTAVNQMLNGFYLEAEGIYNRVVSETAAQHVLEEDELPTVVNVKVDYECFFNGRLLGVIMCYEVAQEDTVSDSTTEYAMYDLYTGQYITPEMLFDDLDGLYLDICGDIAHESEDEHDKASDYSVVYIAANDDDDDDIPAIALILHDGEIETYEIELADYDQYVSRYGRILLGFNRFAALELSDDEEEIEEIEEEDIDEVDEEIDEEVDEEED